MDRLTSMQVFCAVVEEGAFTRAARRMHLSNAVVSKHVAALEEALQTRLLHRTTRRLGLTASGQAYYARAKELVSQVQALERDLLDDHSTPRGLLRVAVPMSLGLAEIAPRLPQLFERYPELQVDLSLTDRMVDVVEEGVDVAIRVRRDLPDSTLIATRLCAFSRVLTAAPAYLAKRGTPAVPSDLAAHACILYGRMPDPALWTFVGPHGEQTVRVQGPLTVDNSFAMQACLVAGVGIALTPAFVVHKDLDAKRLTVCLPGFEPAPRSVFALYPTAKHLSPKVRAFVDFMREALAPR